MRDFFAGCAIGAVMIASIGNLLKLPTPWEILAAGVIAALLAIAWRPVGTVVVTVNPEPKEPE